MTSCLWLTDRELREPTNDDQTGASDDITKAISTSIGRARERSSREIVLPFIGYGYALAKQLTKRIAPESERYDGIVYVVTTNTENKCR